jgi:hypothetical protein
MDNLIILRTILEGDRSNHPARIVRRVFPVNGPWIQAELLDPDFLPDG